MRWLVALLLLLPGCVQVDPTALAPGKGGIVGTVVETQDEQTAKRGPPSPLADALVLVYHRGNPITTTNTDADGFFRIRDLAPGNYEVRAGKEGWDVPVQGARVLADGYVELRFEAHPLS